MKKSSLILLLVIFIFSLNIQAQQSSNTSMSDTTGNEVYTLPEEMPSFPGDESAMYKFIQENTVYPQEEQKANIQGKVFVSFIVQKDGKISDAQIMRGVNGGPGLGKEALRVINSMPAWNPGKQNGRAVKVQFTLPINFILKEEIRNKSNE